MRISVEDASVCLFNLLRRGNSSHTVLLFYHMHCRTLGMLSWRRAGLF